MAILLLIIGLILFVGLVVIHEFGHFIMARRNGVDVEEFGIGFPPAIWRKRIKSPKGDYDFTLNALPLGGFVKMKGEHDSDTEPGSFGAATLSGKVKIMVAGVFMNLVTAFVLFTLVALVGTPQLFDNQFTVASDTKVTRQAETTVVAANVNDNTPASRAGLKNDDVITGVAGARVDTVSQLQKITAANGGKKVTIAYERDGKAATTTAQLNNKSPYLGVSLGETRDGFTIQRSTWSAPIVAGGLIGQFTKLTLEGLGTALKGVGSIVAGAVTGNSPARQAGQSEASSQVSGPVGIFVVLKEGSAQGYQVMLFIVALISLSLAIMNILPIPALDGGRLWFTLLARAFGHPLSEAAEERINAIGFFVLIGLIGLITVVDVKRFF